MRLWRPWWILGRRILHVRPGVPYHRENSRRGVATAKAAGFHGIDLDGTLTADLVLCANHWLKPLLRDGFRAPRGSGIAPDARIDRLTWAQVRMLRTRDGHVIHKMADLLAYAAEIGLPMVVVEAKPCDGITLPRVWRDLAAAVPDGLTVVVKMRTVHPQCDRVLAAAADAGLRVARIRH